MNLPPDALAAKLEAAPAKAPPPGAQHQSLREAVAAELKRRILEGELAQGERLVEGKLSEQLGVSRIPVREALRELAAEGLVSIEPRRGASVSAVSDEVAQELVEVRATLEALNAKLAAQRREGPVTEQLKQLLAQGRQARASGDTARFVALNARSHELIAVAADNGLLIDLMRSLRERTALMFAPLYKRRAQESWDEHEQILQAVISGDAELAAVLASRHVHNAAAAYDSLKAPPAQA